MNTTNQPVEITSEQFENLYKPVKNHLLPEGHDGPWDSCMFETHDAEYEYVINQDPNKIWTILDNGFLQIVSGFHYINRMGYIITENPWQEPGVEVVDEDERKLYLTTYRVYDPSGNLLDEVAHGVGDIRTVVADFASDNDLDELTEDNIFEMNDDELIPYLRNKGFRIEKKE